MIAVSAPFFFDKRWPLTGNLSLSVRRHTRIFPSVDVDIRLVVMARETRDSYLTQISFVIASLW